MSSRFEIAPDWVQELTTAVVESHFRILQNEEARILVLYDLKKRMNQNRIVFGRLAKAKDEMNVLATLAQRDPYDYVMYLDKTVFTRMEADDRLHLIRHELSHALGEERNDGEVRWGIVGHDYEMFHWELEEPGWRERTARWSAMASSLYDSDGVLPAELPPTDPSALPAPGQAPAGETIQ